MISLQFLLDHILDLDNQKGPAFERAALISPFVNSVTLGPNSSYRVPVTEEETPSDDELSEEKAPKKNENLSPQLSPSPVSTPVTTNDLELLRIKLQGQTEERNLREKVQKLLEERATKEREHEEKMQIKVEAMKLEVERKYLERIENLEKQLAMALKIEEQEELSYQNHRSELTKNARKVIEQQEKELLESTKRFEEDFNKHEANFNQIVRACNQANSKAIDSYKMQFEAVKSKKIASRSLGSLKNACIEADEICNALKVANKAFEENMKALKEAEAQKAAEEVEKTKIAAQAVIVTQPQLPPPPAPDQQIHTPDTKRHYTELMQFLSEKQNATRHFREAEQFQELRFRLKVAVNGPINHLNEQNKNSLIEGFQKLQSLLSGQKVSGSKGEVSVTEHPEATDWTKLRIAEKLIDVGDKKKEAVYFIAAITVALWQQFPDFGQMFLAQLFKECPFLVPHKPGQMTNQSDIDFLRSWGYRVTDKAEEYKIYQDRTSNYAQLLAAVWITSSRRNITAPHPYGIDNGWTYLVNIMRSDPDPMYLHFIDKVFEIAGSTLQSTYGHQFKKLVFLVHNSYLRALEGRVDEGMKAAWDRLDVMVVKFFNEGKFEKPAKKLHGNFW